MARHVGPTTRKANRLRDEKPPGPWRPRAIPRFERRTHRSSRRVGALAVAVALTSAAACGGSQPQSPVDGRIAYDFGDRVERSTLDGSDIRLLVRRPRQRPGDVVWWPGGSSIA